jgi:basic membrane lipoprotein Med (substrate-binding protein (PBP1-ABC) superfamily)
MSESKKVSRRNYLKYAGTGVVGLAVGAAAGYYGGLSTVSMPSTPATASTVTQTVTQSATMEIPNPFIIATVNAGPAGTQWGSAMLRGQPLADQILAKTFPDIKTKWLSAWSVKPTDKPSVYAGFISQGANMIWDSDFTQTLDKPLIEANPGVTFIESAFSLASTPNAGAYEWDAHLGAFLEGIVGGALTKTNKLGAVQPFNDIYDALIFNCYRQGAKLVNSKAECYYVFTGDYHDVSLGFKAATALASAGCDFICGQGDGMTTGAIKGAQAAHVYAMGVYSDQYALAPDTVVASTLWNCGICMSDIMSMIWKGNWPRVYYPGNPDFLPHPHFRYFLKDNTVSLTPFNSAIPVPDIVNSTIATARAGNAAGTFDLTTDTTWPEQLQVS